MDTKNEAKEVYTPFLTMQIVELSLLVKKDMESTSLDPCANHHLTLASSNPAQFGSTHTFITTPLTTNTAAGGSPPTSPTSPNHTSQVGSPIAASTGSRTPKGRKKRQKVCHWNLDTHTHTHTHMNVST